MVQRLRHGSASALIVAMMFVFVITTAITVDYAYMQLVRTEMRSACDAAAKAGAEALSRTQNVNVAKNEAVRYAAANSVGGQPLRLSTDAVIIGRVAQGASGKWNFKAGETQPNAVRVTAATGNGLPMPSIPLYFSRVMGGSGFTPSVQSVAGQQEVEVCLSLDRSGSMNLDMSGRSQYPPNAPRDRPHPQLSRWAALNRAVEAFLKAAGESSTPPRTSLVTWASDNTIERTLPSVGTPWKDNADSVRGKVKERGERAINGTTNLAGGLDRAVAVLQGANSNRLSNKVVILLTDGDWNEGRNPVNAAYDARAAGITVHTVSMLTRFQADLQAVAEITGGRYYGTNDEAGLYAAFEEIGRSLPVVLTD